MIAISILIDNYACLLLYEMKNLKPILLKYFNNDSKEYALPICDSIHNISNHEKKEQKVMLLNKIFMNLSKEYSSSNKLKDLRKRLKKSIWISPYKVIKTERKCMENFLCRNESHNIDRPFPTNIFENKSHSSLSRSLFHKNKQKDSCLRINRRILRKNLANNINHIEKDRQCKLSALPSTRSHHQRYVKHH